MVKEADLKPGQPRLLAVDNEMVVPVNKVVRVQVIGADVIHAFTVPSFGIKIDAIPGRLNETWFRATQEGMFYGQCSELCGKDHAFMPIGVRVVWEQAYAAWLEDAKKKYADSGTAPAKVAAAETEAKSDCSGRAERRRQQREQRRSRRNVTWRRRRQHMALTGMAPTMTTRTPSRPAGGGSSIRRTTRTSARCTSCSPSSAA